MVFNSAEAQPADSGYTSFLSRLGNRASTSVASSTSHIPKPASKPQPTSITSKANGVSTVTPDLNANGMKRKAEEDLFRPKKAQETGKIATFANRSAPGVAAGPAKAPKKGSYQDLLNRAKATTQKAPVGAIVNKPKTPVDKPLKEWQKKFQEERAAKTGGGRTSKSPGSAPAGEKPAIKGIEQGVEKGGILSKKTGADTIGPLKRSASGVANRKVSVSGTSSSKAKASTVEPKPRPPAPTKERDRERSPQRRSSRDDYPPPKGRSSVYDRPKPRQQGRYVYKEDLSDYTDSDMEATGMDILEEEEISAKRARLEDLEQERLEKKLAAEKKARKKTSIGPK